MGKNLKIFCRKVKPTHIIRIITDVARYIKIYAKNEGAAGYLGTDPLNYVGYKNEGIVKVTLPYGQKSATIQFNSISVKDNTGSYTVIFESTDPVNVDYSSISGQYPLI